MVLITISIKININKYLIRNKIERLIRIEFIYNLV